MAWGEQAAKIIEAISPLVLAAGLIFVLWQIRHELPGMARNLTGFEGFGLKLSVAGQQAITDAVEMARKNDRWPVEASLADQRQAIARAQQQASLLHGAEVLWVDDQPANNRNEARMLTTFGVAVTFAVSTEEAISALRQADANGRPFHAILSDISRGEAGPLRKAGIDMLATLRNERFRLPVIFYVGKPSDRGAPDGAFGITNRPDGLLNLLLDVLARVRLRP